MDILRLSKTDTAKDTTMEGKPLTDPLDSYFLIPGNNLSFTGNVLAQYFTVTTDSYISLCFHLYELLCAEDSRFKDEVCESAFHYYTTMLLWQRLRQLLPLSVVRSSPFLDKLSYFEEHLMMIPRPLEIYLKGIGNFRHPYLGEMRFQLPSAITSPIFDLTTGAFGKITDKTHFLYEAFPAPGVAALRILADLKHTNSSGDAIWDLPQHLRPDHEVKTNQVPMPTINLLGWFPAQSLTDGQQRLLKTLGIPNDYSEDDMSILFLNSCKLLRTISEYFWSPKPVASRLTSPLTFKFGTSAISTTSRTDEVIKKVKLEESSSSTVIATKETSTSKPASFEFALADLPASTSKELSSQQFPKNIPVNNFCGDSIRFGSVNSMSTTGSIVQGLCIKKVNGHEPYAFDRYAMYCEGKISVFSTMKVIDNFATGGAITAYRMPKEQIHNHHTWSCYDYDGYKEVPESWIHTRNEVYNLGSIQELNQSMWFTGAADKWLLQHLFLEKHAIVN
ncbi:uncharacterized protein LOC124181606 [Neodiprion fabricii]|uniref:uncharacterized protein LOC124181606 n=1 Tax=Neodiprion fabricii TaxID=2872261 RepID=UPI001ED8DA7B|nr:uncharacterized protein LOC124181606 [Neodiprion fabricii]